MENMSNVEAMRVIARGLLKEKGLPEMDMETEADMVNDLVERMSEFVNRAILEKLPEEKMTELDKMIDEDNAGPEAVTELIKSAGIDIEAATVEALEKFREIYLGAEAENE